MIRKTPIHCLLVMLLLLSGFSHVQPFVTPWTSLPGSSVHGILQEGILELVAIPFSNVTIIYAIIFVWRRNHIMVCYSTFLPNSWSVTSLLET